MWLDIVFFAVLVLFAIIGIKKGFFDSILSLISTGVALVVSILLAKPAASFINKIVNLPGLFEKLLTKAGVGDSGFSLFGIDSLSFTRTELSTFLSMVASVIIVFLLIKIAILLLSKLFASAVENSTIASGLNKTLGLIFGIVRGLVIILVVLVLASVLNGTKLLGDKIQTTVDKTKVTGFVYKYVNEATQKALEKGDLRDSVRDLVISQSE